MKTLGSLVVAGCLLGSQANAQQIIYTPVNPAFGGSSFNYSYLQGTADTQNQFRNKPKTSVQTDYTQQFIQMLETRLYSGLAQKVSDTLFGDNCKASCSGEIALGDQTVSYVNDGTKLSLQITDVAGKVTTITVPTFTSSSAP